MASSHAKLIFTHQRISRVQFFGLCICLSLLVTSSLSRLVTAPLGGRPRPVGMRMTVNKYPAVEVADCDHRGKRMTGGEAETDTESGGSSTEEGESPRSVTMWRRRKATASSGCLHSQVLKVMEEDLHLGEDDIVSFGGGECDHSKAGIGKISDCVGHQIVILARPMLPSSRLSGKAGGGSASSVKTA